jgi:SAM-dependent methyltransferase
MRNFQEALIRLIGPRSLLLLGDTLVLDRWRWIKPRLPASPASLVDVGCGNGWLAINCSGLGYRTLGLGWDGADLARARGRAARLGSDAQFEVQDVRALSARHDLKESFDIATCFETIEHILDDAGVMASLANILRPGGRLFLTTPNEAYIPIDAGDSGPFSVVEDGGHVRKGYTGERLQFLAVQAGLEITEIGFCSSWYSQRITGLIRYLSRYLGYGPAWALTLPFRLVPTSANWHKGYPPYSICMSAIKS